MSEVKELSIDEQISVNEIELSNDPTNDGLIAEKEALLKSKIEVDWLAEINATADEKAKELSLLFNCEVVPSVYVVEPLKDAAIAFIKQPDAKQALKIMRSLGENYENGLELAARSQLIRTADLSLKQVQGEASDSRFMDVNGKYDFKDSALNLALLLKVGKITTIYQDEFKKK